MKKLSFNLPLFEVTHQESEQYGMWAKKTCILLYGSDINKKGEEVCKKGKYYPLVRIFEKENWSLDEIRSAYNNAVKHHGNVSAEVAWYSGGMKKYQIIYADPPWAYNDKMSGHSFSLDHEYETQSKDWISKLNVADFADSDCILFMWAVSPQLQEALDVMKAWGFKYKTVAFCWSKVTKNGKPVSNLGRWTMGNVELCLLGVKGTPNKLRLDKTIKQLVVAERTKHSKKPDEVRNRIVCMLGDLPRIELFAREKTEGWDVWGNEVESDITL